MLVNHPTPGFARMSSGGGGGGGSGSGRGGGTGAGGDRAVKG